MLSERRADFDVTNQVRTTDVTSVAAAVMEIYEDIYGPVPLMALEQAFHDWERLFTGKMPGFMACDTPYHDLQHSLDVTLAMARMIWGAERKAGLQIGPFAAMIGLLTALFHDAGLIRSWYDYRHRNGAELTVGHVSRSGTFLERYLPTIRLAHASNICRRIVHFTGYEMTIEEIPVNDQRLRSLGKMVGSADLLAQMADRCYLEKCRDRLYPEFVAAGVASPDNQNGGNELLRRTPGFFDLVERRLKNDLGGADRFMDAFFGKGPNLYKVAISGHRAWLEKLLAEERLDQLKRQPPWTLPGEDFPIDVASYQDNSPE